MRPVDREKLFPPRPAPLAVVARRGIPLAALLSSRTVTLERGRDGSAGAVREEGIVRSGLAASNPVGRQEMQRRQNRQRGGPEASHPCMHHHACLREKMLGRAPLNVSPPARTILEPRLQHAPSQYSCKARKRSVGNFPGRLAAYLHSRAGAGVPGLLDSAQMIALRGCRASKFSSKICNSAFNLALPTRTRYRCHRVGCNMRFGIIRTW